MTLYAKPALTLDQQVDQLLRRGMVGDRESIKSRLSTVNYYRLSAYWYPFRKHGATSRDRRLDDFADGTAFDTIWDRYVFDQKLRLIVMEAIERIEVAARTQIAYTHAHAWSPDAYASNPASLPRLLGEPEGPPSHARFLNKLQGNIRKSKDSPFIRHFQEHYPASEHLPIWMATEIMSMGDVATMYRGLCDRDRSEVSEVFGVTNPVFLSWLTALQTVRNICAHHSRLWNRTLAKIPQLPARGTHATWYTVKFSLNRVFAALTICNYMLTIISPSTSTWPSRVMALILKEHPVIPIRDMGFPSRWQEFPLWVEAAGNVS